MFFQFIFRKKICLLWGAFRRTCPPVGMPAGTCSSKNVCIFLMRPLFKVPLKFWYFDISPISNKVNQKQKKTFDISSLHFFLKNMLQITGFGRGCNLLFLRVEWGGRPVLNISHHLLELMTTPLFLLLFRIFG